MPVMSSIARLLRASERTSSVPEMTETFVARCLSSRRKRSSSVRRYSAPAPEGSPLSGSAISTSSSGSIRMLLITFCHIFGAAGL